MTIGWRRLSRMNISQIREMQDRLLSAYLREELIPFSAYYRKKLATAGIDPEEIHGVRDLPRLPFTTKKDIIDANADDPTCLVLKPEKETIKKNWPLSRSTPLFLRGLIAGKEAVRRRLEKEYFPIFMTATTGRSARPTPFLYTRTDLKRLATAGRRLADVLGCTTYDRGLNLFPYAPHLAFWQVAFAGFEAGLFMLSTGGGKTIGTLGNIRAMERIRPSLLLGVPSYVYHCLRTAHEMGIDLSNLRRIVLGAEKTTDSLRRKLSQHAAACGATDVHVMGTYGFTEAKIAWAECPGGEGYHLFPDMGVVEIIDPETGEIRAEGESGEIVFTPIGARGTVVLRYRTGDFVEGGIVTEPCPGCGRTVPRLGSRITRLTNRKDLNLTKVKGTLVDLNNLVEVLSARPEVEEWQIEIRKRNDDPDDVDELIVYVAPAAGDEIDREELKRRIFDGAEVRPNEIVIEDVASVIKRIGLETEMKENRILDRREEAGE